MRVIITGGTGLIGRALTASLVDDDHEVIILSRTPDEAWGLPDGVRVEEWDARTAKGWGHLVDGADAIVNLAGQSLVGRWSKARKAAIRESRLRAGRAIAEAVEWVNRKPSVVVQASGAGYYGPLGDEEVAEDGAPGRDFLGRTAVDWERSTVAVADVGVRHVAIRTGVVLTLAGGSLPLMLLPFRLFVGGPMGSGRQWMSWIHIVDEVRAIRFLIEKEEARGPFNLVAPTPVTNGEFSRTIGRVMRRPAFVPAPAVALRLVLGEMSTVVLDGQRLVPRGLLDLGFTFRFPEAEGALRDLLGKS